MWIILLKHLNRFLSFSAVPTGRARRHHPNPSLKRHSTGRGDSRKTSRPNLDTPPWNESQINLPKIGNRLPNGYGYAPPFIASARIFDVLDRIIRGSTSLPSNSVLRTSLPEMNTGFSSLWLSIKSTRPADS